MEEIPGLPTRAELKAMVAEHDVIEKETEIFDTGELKKLRQLTKGMFMIPRLIILNENWFRKLRRSETFRLRTLT